MSRFCDYKKEYSPNTPSVNIYKRFAFNLRCLRLSLDNYPTKVYQYLIQNEIATLGTFTHHRTFLFVLGSICSSFLYKFFQVYITEAGNLFPCETGSQRSSRKKLIYSKVKCLALPSDLPRWIFFTGSHYRTEC